MTSLRDIGELRVLIVDDDTDARSTVASLFRHAGVVDLSEADGAQAALPATHSHQPHLIVLDLAMPGRSGFDILPDLLDAAPHALVVVLSNLPRRRLWTQLERRGAVGYVEKRVPPDRLVTEILAAAALADLARHHVLGLHADPTAPRKSRRFVRGLLDERDTAIAHDVELLVSELVSNAVLHTSSDPRVEIRLTDTTVRVEVYDDEPNVPAPREADGTGPGGRGLRLVEEVAAQWGFEQIDGGKVVWFEITRSPISIE